MSKTASISTSRVGEEFDIETEITECRRYGYILNKKFLGSGAYAQVFSGQPTLSKIRTNSKLRASQKGQKSLQVAIKVVDVKTAPESYITKFLPREISAMSKCNGHPNVVKLLDLFATEKKIYLVLEFAESGDLLRFVNKSYLKKVKGSNGYIEEDRAKEILRDILAGVTYIHTNGVAHRDLKCENILLSKNGTAKLSDFGFAIQTGDDNDLLKTHCGSYAYAAPEILRKLGYCGKPADMWSLGVILFAMLHGCLPFKGSSSKEVLKAMKKTIFLKPTLTAECKDFIRGLLKMRPSSRLTTKTVASHPWLTGYDSKLGYKNKGIGDSKVEKATISASSSTKKDSDTSVFTRPCKFDNPKYVSAYLQKVLRKEEAALRKQIRKIERRKTPSVVEVRAKPSTASPNKVERKSGKVVRGSCVTNTSSRLCLKSNGMTFTVRDEMLPDVKTASGYDSFYQKWKHSSKIDAVKQAQLHRSPVEDRSEAHPDRSPIQLLEEVERKLTKRQEIDGKEKAIEHIKTCFAQTTPNPPPLEYRIKTRNDSTSRPPTRENNIRMSRCRSGQAYDQQYQNLLSKIGNTNILPATTETQQQQRSEINTSAPVEVRRPSSSSATATYYKRYLTSTSSMPPVPIPSNPAAAQQQADAKQARMSLSRQHYVQPPPREIISDLIITSLFPSK